MKYRGLIGHLGWLAVSSAFWLNAADYRIYVLNGGGTTVSVIDSKLNAIVQTIHDIEAPLSVHFSPDGRRAYITAYSANLLHVIDTKTGNHLMGVPLSGRPDDLAVSKDGRTVVVNIQDRPGALDVVDTTAMKMVKAIPTSDGQWLHDVVLTPDDRYAIAGSPDGRKATVFDVAGREIAWEYHTDQGVMPLAIEPGPGNTVGRLFLQLRDLNGFVAVNWTTRKEVVRTTFPQVANEFKIKDAFSHGMELAPDRKTIWFASRPNNAVYVYSMPDLKLLGHVPLPEITIPGKEKLGADPNWMTFTPDGRMLYVTNTATNSVSAIDAKNMKVIKEITVGEAPAKLSTLTVP